MRQARDLVRVGTTEVGVPDPEATAAFFAATVGLVRTRLPDAIALSCGTDYGLAVPVGQLILREAPETRVRSVTFDLGVGADREALRARLVAAGSADEQGEHGTIVTADPDGVEIRIRSDAPVHDRPLDPDPLRPRRLGHVNLKVTDPVASAAFYTDVLGLALSEQIGDRFYFLRAGTEHHAIGIRPVGADGIVTLHHAAFEVDGWETYRPVADRLAALGHTIEYGPGRHTPGNSLFVYIVDPSSGFRVELYADMAHILDDDAYVPKRWELTDRGQTVNRWGPWPPESFLA